MTGNQDAYKNAMNQGHNAAWEQNWDEAARWYQQALDALQEQADLGLADGGNVLAIERDGAVLGSYVAGHPIRWRGARRVDRSALHGRGPAQVGDELAQPLQVAHLVAGDGLDLAGNAAFPNGVRVEQVLDDGRVLPAPARPGERSSAERRTAAEPRGPGVPCASGRVSAATC